MTWLMVARIFDAISFLITSTGLTPSLSARSLTVRVGGSTALRSPLGSTLTATEAGLNAERAASIAHGARGDAGCRVSRSCWRKFTSSFWLIPSSPASSWAFIQELLIIPNAARAQSGPDLGGQLRPELRGHRPAQRALQLTPLPRVLDAPGV